jgi:hypothetical protein
MANGVRFDTGGKGTLKGCLVQGNTPYNYNTAGILSTYADLEISDCIISGNSRGIMTGNNNVSVTNCQISANYGPGIEIGTNSHVNVNYCTVADNQGDSGDGLFYSGSGQAILTVANTIFSGNSRIALNLGNFGPINILSNCLFYHNASGDYHDGMNGTLTGSGRLNLLLPGARDNLTGNPKFANPSAGDYHLLDDSAALDRRFLTGAPTTDLEGHARPGTDGMIDIGAYEADPSFKPAAPSLPPDSYVEPLPLATTSATLQLHVVAWDNDSTVVSNTLFYRHNGGSWRQYGSVYTPGVHSIRFDSHTTGGDGFYEFYSQATDSEGHIEAPPSAPDTHIAIDTTHIYSRVYVNQNATGLKSGTTWKDAVDNLADGLGIAKLMGVKEVWVARGNYSQSIEMWNDLKLYGGFAGNESSISARHIADNPTTITSTSGDAIQIPGVRNNVVDGFIIVGYNGYSTSYYNINAHDLGGTLQVVNCQFTGTAGMKLVHATAQVTSCTFYSGISASNTTLTVAGCTFEGGRGITGTASTLNLSNSTFSNLKGPGGALSCDTCTVRMSGCIIRHCKVGSVPVAASKMMGKQNVELIWFPDTTPAPYGAGINAKKSKLRLENCLLYDNKAGYKPPMNMSIPTEPLGGAIYIEQNSVLDCFHCSFVDNRLYLAFPVDLYFASGSAIYASSDSSVNLYNSIFSGNNYYAVTAGNLNLNYCLFYNNPDGDTTGTVSRAVGVVKGDPMFVNPAAENFRLQASSPAIDAGMKVWSPIVDRDGQPRGVKGTTASRGDGANYDIGAYEYQPVPPIVSVIYPDGGEKLRAGTAVTVAWWANGRSAGKSVQLELWKAKTKVATLGTASNALGYGTVSFTLSGTLTGSDFRIRAQSLAQSSLVDWSDKPFTILAKNGVPAAHWLGYE